ncbi:MAG: asparagine synthase (glutamine-hydrolyzing) [Actinomycetia bacterium]|nr:asparagine synthase (glutamine-hydrolyzing) [Actinomycetes bacterium]
MCGIVGFAGSDPALLEQMLRSIVHRGPDGQGTDMGRHFSIGMRRLAIIDVATGDQPLYSDDGNLALVFNGEIYNHVELRRELQQRGRRFVTDHSDSEVILRGFEEWGRNVVDHLTGMFAFAISDHERGELFLARDRLGIKPLYYVDGPEGFAFASELKALFQNARVARRPDVDALRRFLLFRLHDDGEDTFFDGVKRLLPAHTMLVRPDGIVKIERYWNPSVNPEFASTRSDDDYAQEFAQRWDDVIRRHLISDVPVGVPLSGGLDSSGVATTMARLRSSGTDLHTQGLYTFSALYPGESIDESEYIHEVERAIDSTPHYAYPQLDDFWNEIDDWIWYQEEPTIASAPYAYYSVYRLAGQHVKVMVSGNGGDELLAGYIPYFRAYLSSAIAQRHYLAAAREVVKGRDLYKKYAGELIRSKLPSRGANAINARELLQAGSTSGVQFASHKNLNERLASDVLQYSTPDLLRYEDKNSMAFSVESRVPFLDHELVEFIFSLPIDQKIKGGWNRAVYRNAMKGRMPEKNRLRRSKIGFTNPDIMWMKAKAREIRAVFSSPELAARDLYNPGQLVTAWDEYLAGRPGDGLIFWRVLVTELWMRRYMDQAVAV